MRERLKREALRVWSQARKTVLRLRIGRRWQRDADDFQRREYPSYEAYVQHQRTKLDAMRARSLERHDARFHEALSSRLAALPLDLRGLPVLCLAARQGTEVRAFTDRGAFAVGIDLNPGKGNRWVVVGDFHDLQFADDSVGLVYTNSLDHAFDLDRIMAEVRRVLRPDGHFLAEVGRGGEAGGFYESLAWSSVDDLVATILARGFELVQRVPFDRPWAGEQLLLRPVPP